jgi:hypothetical protein
MGHCCGLSLPKVLTPPSRAVLQLARPPLPPGTPTLAASYPYCNMKFWSIAVNRFQCCGIWQPRP